MAFDRVVDFRFWDYCCFRGRKNRVMHLGAPFRSISSKNVLSIDEIKKKDILKFLRPILIFASEINSYLTFFFL